MLRLYIDNQPADIGQDTVVEVSLSMASQVAMEWGRTTYAKDVVIPLTPRNQRLMGDAHHPLTAQRFNNVRHTVRVECDGSVVAEGDLFLTASQMGAEGYYKFDIVGSERGWVSASQAPLADLGILYDKPLSVQTIRESWDAVGAKVRFMPVERGLWQELPANKRALSLVDYHPFLHLRSIVEAIFEQAGYRVVSKFFGSDWFRRLYMSGRWAEHYKVAELFERNNFVAVRSGASGVQQADFAGRVAANPLANYNTIGNLVDSTDKVLGGKNDCDTFAVDEQGRICFRPAEEVGVAFECRVRYTTQTKILSRTSLRAFGTIHFDHDTVVELEFPNRYEDRRKGALNGSQSYSLLIFSPRQGREYHLIATRQEQGVEKQVLLVSTTQRWAQVVLERGVVYTNPRLVVVEGGTQLVDVAEDWALYDGYVEEFNTEVVDHTFITKPEVVRSAEPRLFDTFYLGGAEEGMTIEVLEGCYIRPIFLDMPRENSLLGWSDVAAFEESQFELLTSLKNLFDLRFYTDTREKVVYIEPQGELYNNQVVDWLERMVADGGIVVSELGAEATRHIRVAYAQGDKRVDELAEQEGAPFGSWTARVDNVYAPNRTTDIVAQMFTPSLVVADALPTAPSAQVVDVSGAAGQAERGFVRLNFATKLVYYNGLVALPSGEQWGWPAERDSATLYPQVLFFAPSAEGVEGGVSLLIEDREGIVGLNRFWRHRLARLNTARRIELSLRLFPDEVEAVAMSGGSGADFRALYKLSVEGEEVLCRLERIAHYNPVNPTARCTFVTLANNQ